MTIDLDGYFQRVGYQGTPRPDLATLHTLTRAHAQAIPFENIDVLLGRAISLDVEALYYKLVTRHRGGYCFEQNGLLLAVLTQLGFTVRPLGGRVRLEVPNRGSIPGRTHLLLEVQLAGQRWITDVGVGSASLTRALRLEPDCEQPTPHDVRRLAREDGRWFHQLKRDGAWLDVYEFSDETMPLADRVIANWYTSTYPTSHFRSRLLVALALADGGRATLKDKEFTLRQRDGTVAQRVLDGRDEQLQVLRETFGIDLPADTPLACVGA